MTTKTFAGVKNKLRNQNGRRAKSTLKRGSPPLNRETTKNALRGRNCENCGRHSRWSTVHCELWEKKPDVGVCDQWKMSHSQRMQKNWRHKIEVAKKRKSKKEAKRETSDKVS